MESPKLDRPIRLERAAVTQDSGSGENVETWAELATVWAAAMPVSDGEKVAAAEVSATISMRFQIRWDSSWSDLNPKDRVVFDGRTFDIWGVKELGRRQGLEITASARAE